MTKVGERPLQSVGSPSCCEILRRPSHVLLIVLRSTSSTAQAASAGFRGATAGPATHSGAALLDQKTSLQHVVIPRLGCRSRNWVSDTAVTMGMCACDCRRTRTTSSGVTAWSISVGRRGSNADTYPGATSGRCPWSRTASSAAASRRRPRPQAHRRWPWPLARMGARQVVGDAEAQEGGRGHVLGGRAGGRRSSRPGARRPSISHDGHPQTSFLAPLISALRPCRPR